MNDLPPHRGATPDDIEAALQQMRAEIAVAPPLKTAPPPRPAPRRREGSWATTTLLVLFAAVLGGIVAFFLSRYAAPAGPDQDIVALRQQVSALQAELDDRESRLLSASARSTALVLAALRVSEAAGAGLPFRDELGDLTRLAPSLDAGELALHADGVPSHEALEAWHARLGAAGFPRLWALMTPSTAAPRELADLLRDTEALGDAQRVPYEPWIAAAKARLMLDAATARMTGAILGLLAP